VLTDDVRSETWPGGKVAAVDRLDPRGWYGIPTGGMQELDVLHQVGSVVGTVGTVRGIHVETNVTEAFVFHAFVNHASVVAWCWGMKGDGPKVVLGVSQAAHDKTGSFVSDSYFCGREGSSTAVVT
jgi:hypothetical protein